MRWKFWEKPPYPIELEVYDSLGKVIGTMTFKSNGKFTGKIEADNFRIKMESAIKKRFVASVKLTANFRRPEVPWEGL